MSEMIDRVAQLLAKLDEEQDWELYRKDARLVIEALRDPTDAMCEAGYSAGTGDWGGKYDNRRELSRGRVLPGYVAMIDAALETKSPAHLGRV